MRRFSSLNLTRPRTNALIAFQKATEPPPWHFPTRCVQQSIPSRSLAQVRDDKVLSELWFSSALPRAATKPAVAELVHEKQNSGPPQPPDERTLKLGRSEFQARSTHSQVMFQANMCSAIGILHERLPVLLASPLPQEILSPQISLHLFPSTHPHLPTVSGRLAYSAALWTAPVAWGRVPVVGNVRLIILSERMIKNGGSSSAHANANRRYRNEKLIVRWRTCGKSKGGGMGAFTRALYGGHDPVDKITEFLGGKGDPGDDEFSGLFMFEFDEEGRIVEHTIEHALEGRNMEKMTRVVSVTDWLIGLAKGKRAIEEPGLALGYCEVDDREHLRRLRDLDRRRDI